MATKIQVVFYSMYGHVYKMAEAVAEGAREAGAPRSRCTRWPSWCRTTSLEQSGAKAARAAFAHVPVGKPDQLADADAIIFGTPTRFGNMCAQMRNFLDQTGGLWMKGSLIGKVGSVFTSTGTQHGGQETTITSFHTTLLHHGMIIVGVPYSEQRADEHERDHRRHALTARARSPAATARANRARTNWPSPASKASTWRPSPGNSSAGAGDGASGSHSGQKRTLDCEAPFPGH